MKSTDGKGVTGCPEATQEALCVGDWWNVIRDRADVSGKSSKKK